MHSIRTNIDQLARQNQRLADELTKLPEIKSFQTPSVSVAVNNFREIYQMAPEAMDTMFGQIDSIGKAAERKYCSPLQGVFWMIQDEKISGVGALLGVNIEKTTDTDGHCRAQRLSQPADQPAAEDGPADQRISRTLKKILDAAWQNETELMPDDLIHGIIQRIRTTAEKEEYALLIQRHSDRQLQGYIMDDYMMKKGVFDAKDTESIESAIRKSRWKRFYTVADRLNAPRIISYYIENYFNFRKIPAHGVYMTFFKNRAQCTDAAYFAQYMLRRAGYETFIRSVKWDNDPWDGLHTGAGIIRDDGSYQLVSNFTGVNAIGGGPCKDVAGLDEKLSGGRKIIGSRWGAYYPPRHY